MKPKHMLRIAAGVSRLGDQQRHFYVGSIGIRSDGTIVSANNGSCPMPEPKCHSEYRLSRKLTKNSIVYVARTLADGTWGKAKPCPDCWARLKNIGILKCYYTVGPNEYGCIYG